MSLVPMFFRDIWNEYDRMRPSRLVDQHFGLNLQAEDLLSPLTLHPASSIFPNYYRPWRSQLSRQDSGSTMMTDKDKFQVIIDVQQFAPNEVTVKSNDKDTITVEGKHEEKQDEHGYIKRQFTRRYVVPADYDMRNVVSNLSSDGVLTISAPKLAIEVQSSSNERVIPIAQVGPAKIVGEPSKASETKSE